ncbi:hypothetical protein Kisp01_69450 [Kineosporia sp. NBRC 101677]|uniref:hypothetical protein n=1 Tax=Kineosporia sp. NBRC 101677 TaxID=3032197 RepID=UPI0024A43F52|nr:hypothetical protein [Kineosporia sp. NBRC 101677]GLY19931.1 hypothetical protein Kisp01_69450 [Kineosporia sp. NBRC 101677]
MLWTPRAAPIHLVSWVREDVDRAWAALVCFSLGAIALAGSATHVLHVGAYPHVQVQGWMVWTVAGSLEVLAAYAAWEVRRRSGWNQVIPALVFAMALAFIVLANLAAANQNSWAATLPWAEAFAVAPPLSFFSVAAIAETRSWTRPSRPRRAHSRRPHTNERPSSGRSRGTPELQLPIDADDASRNLAVSSSEPDTQPTSTPGKLVLQPGESRSESIARWVQEGHSRRSILAAGSSFFAVSGSTMKRELLKHRQPPDHAA